MLVNFMVICNILQPFGIFYGHLAIYVETIWYIFPLFGILHHEKSGNPASKQPLILSTTKETLTVQKI
jgi:hypothetical protein